MNEFDSLASNRHRSESSQIAAIAESLSIMKLLEWTVDHMIIIIANE